MLRRYRRAAAATGAALQARLDRLASHLGLRFSVPLRISDALTVPTVLGLLRPVLVLPMSALSGLPRGQPDAILAHELAHIRRLDPLFNAP